MSKITTLLTGATLLLSSAFAIGAPVGEPIITMHSDAYYEVGSANAFSILLGATQEATYTIADAYGEREVKVTQAMVESGEFSGSWISCRVDEEGLIRIWGDASNLNTLVADGAYLTTIDMPLCTNLDILSLEYNTLRSLDLTPFTNLMAIYLTGNPFTAETPLVVGVPKPNLQILEIDIMEHLDRNFNLSDYPAMRAFDAYSNHDLWELDPSGCPELLVLSCEMTNVASLDVSHNPTLLRLNISETRISDIDLSKNTALEHFIGGHSSGSINVGYHLNGIDLSHNPALTILELNGNQLSSIDLSHNPKLSNVSLNHNNLTELDLSNNPDVMSLYCFYNNLDFATLPLPNPETGFLSQYFYRQNLMDVPRSIKAKGTLNLSDRVLREGTVTEARVWRHPIGSDPVLLDESLYTYADGKVKFLEAVSDSVYVEYLNDVLNEYSLQTRSFMVKSADDFGKPSKIVTIWPGNEEMPISLAVGMYAASEESPKTFMVDFGDGNLKEFTSDFSLTSTGNNVSGTPLGNVTIYMPEGEVMTSLYINGVPLSTIDITSATELCKLQLSGCGLTNLDLSHNRCLQWLDLSNNQLTELNLTGIYGDYEKNVLAYIDASHNRIASFTNMAPLAAKHLDLSDNALTEIVLKDYDRLEALNLDNNSLEGTLDLTYLYSATSVTAANNNLDGVTQCAENIPQKLDISNNNFNFSNLPLPESCGAEYIYAPQKQLQIANKAPSINLSYTSKASNGVATEYVWKKSNGSALVEGVDYTISNGFTQFITVSSARIYCEMTNAAFPELSGDNALRTTKTTAIERPTDVAVSYLPAAITDKFDPEFIMATYAEPIDIYIDWNESGELMGYKINTSATIIKPEGLQAGKKITVYALSQEDIRDISVCSLYDVTLSEADLSALKKAYCIGLGGTSLKPENIKMPEGAPLRELLLTGNIFKTYPYAEAYPNISLLVLSDCRLKEFDASIIPNVENLVLSNNRIESVKFNNPKLWNLMLENNQLSSINLEGLPSLTQLILTGNQLHEIDLTPVESKLQALSLVGNEFDFSSLPVPAEYPNLQVYYYGNQAPLDAECKDLKVDLSSQAYANGVETVFTWYEGMPEYDETSGELVGNLLEEGTDYTIEDGITTFLHSLDEEAICLMTNETFPNLLLITNLVDIREGGVGEIFADKDAKVNVFTLDGKLVKRSTLGEATKSLPRGIYVINGRKVMVK